MRTAVNFCNHYILPFVVLARSLISRYIYAVLLPYVLRMNLGGGNGEDTYRCKTRYQGIPTTAATTP